MKAVGEEVFYGFQIQTGYSVLVPFLMTSRRKTTASGNCTFYNSSFGSTDVT